MSLKVGSWLKTIGVALAAAALMALAGAGSASAETTVCENEAGTKCYGVGTVQKGSSIAGGGLSKPTLTAPLGSLACESKIEGKFETATTPSGNLTSLTLENCTGGTVSVATLGTVTGHHDAEHNGLPTFSGLVLKTVQSSVTCYYSSEGVTGTGTAGANPKTDITSETKVIDNATHDSSPFCPEKAPFHATFEGTTPAYVVTGV